MTELKCWLQNALSRVFSSAPVSTAGRIDLIAARGENISFQACAKNTASEEAGVTVSIDGTDELQIRIRRVGYVPVAHHNTSTGESELDGVGHIPGYVPDPLFPEDNAIIGPFETQSFWVSVAIPVDINPGVRELKVRFVAGDHQQSELTAVIDVRPFVLHPRHKFPVTHWLYADALCDWYSVEPFEEKFL